MRFRVIPKNFESFRVFSSVTKKLEKEAMSFI